jgi:ribosomal protein S18 acetylase RimI-like enzyme
LPPAGPPAGRRHNLRVQIRAATVQDADAIADVQSRTWFAAYDGIVDRAVMEQRAADRPARWRGHLAQGTPTWLAEDASTPVGIMSAGPSRDDDATIRTGELWMIYVAPEAQGRGVGRALMDEAIAQLRAQAFTEATLWVFEANAAARGFYERLGWHHDTAAGVRPDPWAPEVRYRRLL